MRAGSVVERVETSSSPGEIRLETTLAVERTTWVALRSAGVKRGETEFDPRAFFSSMLLLERRSNEEVLAGLPAGPMPRPSAAHTGAVSISVEGTLALAEQPRGRELARIWLARLQELERRLTDESIAAWARFPGRGDGIDRLTALANRAVLLDAIEAARRHYRDRR